MLVPIMVNSFNTSLITYKDLTCLSYVKKVCVACTRSQQKCLKIDNGTKTVFFSDNSKIDYESYVNSNVKVIYEEDKITMYSCDVHNCPYIHLKPLTYYPIDFHLLYPNYYFIQHDSVTTHTVTSFQHCLSQHCSRIDNMLECSNDKMDAFEFEFDKHVTLKCIQNITSAIIVTSKLTSVSYNKFFHYAFNLIYLRLYVRSTFYFDCYTFQSLRNLRVLEFTMKTLPKNQYECIFQHNRNLIKIKVAEFSIWNKCEFRKYAKFTEKAEMISRQYAILVDSEPILKSRPISIVTISLSLFPVVLLIIFYCYQKGWILSHYRDLRRRRQCEHIIKSVTPGTFV